MGKDVEEVQVSDHESAAMRKCFRLCHYLASAWMGRHSWWVLLLCIVWTLLEGRFISALNDEGGFRERYVYLKNVYCSS